MATTDQRPPWTIAGLAAIFGALLAALLPKATTPTDKPEAAKSNIDGSTAGTARPSLDDAPMRPLRDYFLAGSRDRSPLSMREEVSWRFEKGSIVRVTERKPVDVDDWADLRSQENVSLRFLVCTVPDPGAGYGSIFDQTIEAVQRALATEGYVVDRSWLPWRRPAPGGTAQRRRTAHEGRPGLLLCRRVPAEAEDHPTEKEAENHTELFAVFLVGETPTAGINRQAFKTCLRIINTCPTKMIAQGEGGQLRVIGPYYSGSAESLRLALTTDCAELSDELRRGPKQQAGSSNRLNTSDVVCGSANGFDQTRFRDDLRKFARDHPKDVPSLHSFQTTVLPEALIQRWVYKFLDKPDAPAEGKQPPMVALLHESNTAFGVHSARRPRLPEPRSQVFEVPFPLHISQLRASKSKEQLAKPQSVGLPSSGLNLPVPLGDGEEGDDLREAVEVQAPLMTAVSNDLIISETIKIMGEKKARYVGIVATDVRDTIFLASLIRERAPDVQLFTTGADLLLAHPDYSYAMRGMIVGSTYPLHGGTQSWSAAGEGPMKRRMLFASEASQGYYNATLVHLDAPQNMLDYGWATGSEEVSFPPVWISVVGQDGELIPVYHARADAVKKDVLALKQRSLTAMFEPGGILYQRPWPHKFTPSQILVPAGWLVLFLILLMCTGWCAYSVVKMLRHCQWEKNGEGAVWQAKQRIEMALVCVPIMFFYGVVARLFVVPLLFLESGGGLHFRPDRYGLSAAITIVALSVLAVLGAWGLFVWSYFRQRSREDARLRWMQWMALAAVSGAALVFLGRFLQSSLLAPDPQYMIRFERWTRLGSGVSPLVPLLFLCAATLAWGMFLIKKSYLINQFSVQCPFGDDDKTAPCQGPITTLQGLHLDLIKELSLAGAMRRHWPVNVLAIIFVVACLTRAGTAANPPLEGLPMGVVALVLGFGLNSILLVITCCHFYFAWQKAKKVLESVALLPMCGAFDRLPDRVVHVFGRQLSGRKPRFAQLAIPVHQFEAVRQGLPRFRAELKRCVQDGTSIGVLHPAVPSAVKKVLDEEFPAGQTCDSLVPLYDNELCNGRDEEAVSRTSTAAEIHQRARNCLRILKRLWNAHSMDEAFGRPAESPAAAQSGFLNLPADNVIGSWVHAAEDFAATEVIRYVGQFTAHIRNLLTALMIGSVLLLVAATTYSYVPQNLLLIFLSMLATAVVALMVVFLVQRNRDEIVSRITRTAPNRFTPDLALLQAGATYILPVVVGLMVQFPWVASGVRHVLEPLFHVVR